MQEESNNFSGFDDDFSFGGNNDGFGDDGFGTGNGFDDDFDNLGGNGGFDDDDAFADSREFSGQSQGNQTDTQGWQQDNSGQFADSVNSFDSQNQFQEDSNNDKQDVKKQALIFIVVGVVAIVLIFIIASAIGNRSKNKNSNEQINVEQQQSSIEQQPVDKNVDDVMQDNKDVVEDNTDTKQNVITNKEDDDFVWTIITDSEDIQFNSEYSDMTFTVTNIEHKARVLDTNNNLVVITTLQGSISGLPGTFELDIPYSKGVKLVVGNSFAVRVQLGTYNGKTVVGEIQY